MSWIGGVAPVVELPATKCEALNSNTSTAKKKKMSLNKINNILLLSRFFFNYECVAVENHNDYIE
jgi:hypothetical protein